nr:immunoglobulin heavy chain junction region [Mus musculus]
CARSDCDYDFAYW